LFQPDLVQLKIGSLVFGGWKALDAEVGIEQCSGAFKLSVTDRWPRQNMPWQIRAGDACELLLAEQTVIKGFVDVPKSSFSAQQHGISVQGRDATMDLIDCSAIYKSGQWKNVKLDRIARDICTPFGIEVVVEGDIGAAFDSFNIEMCEKAFETIDRAARMRGVLVTTDGTGRLLLTRASTVKSGASLVEGENVLYGEFETSWKERYSEIIVKGQGKGNETEYGAKVAHGKAKITDPGVTRYRPLIVIAEQHGKGPSFAQRAEWERNVRRGRGTRATIKVQGWTREDQLLWRPNTLVPVKCPTLGIDEELLIAKCAYSKDDKSGTTTTLQLVHPSAFEILEGVKGTKLGKSARGANGLEVSRRHAKAKAKGKGDGAIVDFSTGKTGGSK
jgi:prophage tail gpP-like protein